MFLARCVPKTVLPRLERARNRILARGSDTEVGDTLVEVLIAIVVIGIVASAGFVSISVGATNSKSHRDLVTADQLLRNYAEATKQAVRDKPCTSGNSGQAFTITPPSIPTGFSVTATGPGPGFGAPTCPAITSVNEVDITVTLPNTTTRLLKINVRAP